MNTGLSWFDAFVSHNRRDSSELLVHQLRAAGARISSDHNGAPEDWQFPAFLFGYLSSSRHVVVSIGQKFRLSPWIRAEIKVARRMQARSGLDRILIALSDGDRHVPAKLEGYPRFDISTTEGLQDLASRLVTRNRLTAEMLEARSKLKRETSMTELSEAARVLRAKLDARAEPDPEDESGLWSLAGEMLVDARGRPGFPELSTLPLEVVSALRDSSPLIPAELGDELIAVVRGMLAGGACNSDERVWLLRLLVQVAVSRPGYWDDFLDCLAGETSDAVAKEMLAGVRRAGGPGGSDPRIAMAVLVATDISRLYKADVEHLSAELPEAVLARVQVHGQPDVDLTELSHGERMNIAATGMPASLHSGSALEVWLRELAGLVTTGHARDEWSWLPLNTEKETLVVCVMALTSIDWFIAYSKQHDGRPLVDVDADCGLWPVLFSALHFPELADYARGVADRLQEFYTEQACNEEVPDDFVDYSGLLRAIFANWPSQERIQGAVRAWRMDETRRYMARDTRRALREIGEEEPNPET